MHVQRGGASVRHGRRHAGPRGEAGRYATRRHAGRAARAPGIANTAGESRLGCRRARRGRRMLECSLARAESHQLERRCSSRDVVRRRVIANAVVRPTVDWVII